MKNPFENIFNPSLNKKSPEDQEPFKYMQMPTGGRGLEEHERKLMFKKEDLEGKDILDLGAGPLAKLAQELDEAGISANVVSLSPYYAEKKHGKIAKDNATDKPLIAGLGQNLPFKEESFDVIFAYHVDEHINGREMLDTIKEMARTLKSGGYAKYGTTYEIPNEYSPYKFITSNEEVMKILEKYNVTVEVEEVPEDIIPKQKVKDEYANAFYVPAKHIVLRKHETEKTKH